jgi:hypothetical protein
MKSRIVFMRIVFSKTLFVRILCFAAIPAAASPLTLDWVSPGNNPVGNYYVSPYTAEIQSTGQLITLYCIDFNHEVAPPLEWQANIQTLDLANVPSLQYGASSPNVNVIWQDYEAAAWLITQMTETSNLRQQAIDQYAAWEIFLYPSNVANWQASVNTQGGAFAAQYKAAINAVNSGYTPYGLEVVTPNPAGQPGSTQEFLTFASTPEPESIVLLGTILVIVGLITRLRMRRRFDR